MKRKVIKLAALLLAGLMVLPTVACSTSKEEEETQKPIGTQEENAEETGFKPNIAENHYDAQFNVIGTHTIMKWITAEEDSRGDAFEDTLYERSIRLKEHLGVSLVKIQSTDDDYANEVLRCVQAGDAAYQMVAAHCHIGTATLMSSGAMFDFSKLTSVNLEAPYWSFDFMEDLVINDEYIIGYNDFCLAEAACIVFNKDLMTEFNLKAPYDDVSNKTWTMEKMNSYAAIVSKDNGDNVWDDKDVYGVSGWGWTDLISLMVGCDIKIVDKDEEDEYAIAYENNSEKTLNALTKIDEIYSAEYGYFWSPGTPRGSQELSFGKGQTLMQISATSLLPELRGETVRFGVLPIPLYDESQTDYKSFSWNGVLMIPSVFEGGDSSMVSDAVELLAYYTGPVKTAFYEDLLGTKLAESPEDAAMLDVVWDTQVTDVAMVTADLKGMTELLYMAPRLCINGIETFSSYLRTNAKQANRSLQNFFNPRVRG